MRHDSGPCGHQVAEPYLASMPAASFASSARFSGSSGAGAETPSLSRSSARLEDGLIGWPSNLRACSTAVLKYSRNRSLARAFSNWVSTVM